MDRLWSEAREVANDKKQREILAKLYVIVTDINKVMHIIMLEQAVRAFESGKWDEADQAAFWGE